MNDPFDLTGARVLVTGAGRGIGAEIARVFAARHATVALVARTASEVEAVAAAITADGGHAVARRLDVTDQGSIDEVRDWAADSLGGPVNVLVNNAGIYTPNRFLDYTIAQWQESLDVNVVGPVRLCQAFLPAMLEDATGRIINIASTAGKYGSLNQSAYNASKHALVGLTRCLALEVAPSGVRVNAICPGFVDTDFLIGSPLQGILGVDEQGMRTMIEQRTPIGRPITPTEVATLAVYLAGPGADGMTGMAITLAGGLIVI